MKTFCLANQKGGTSKTTTAAALISGLTKAGFKVLGIELDPQGNLAYIMNAQPKAELINLMKGKASLDNAIIHTAVGDIIPAGKSLASFNGNPQALKECIKVTQSKYDYIVIDTQPTQASLLFNALIAADAVIVSANADPFNIEAIPDLLGTINAVKETLNPNITVEGILITKYTNRSLLNRECVEQLQNIADTAGIKVFKTKIREAVAVREAQVLRSSIFDYAPNATATTDYNEFLKEILNHG